MAHVLVATRVVSDAAAGDRHAAAKLMPLVYDQLRASANRQLATERRDHTLNPTELVHEAFLKLVGPRKLPWANQRHFYAVAAEAMRQILIDHARARGSIKRGGDRKKLSLDFRGVVDLTEAGKIEEIIALDDALRRLATARPRVAQVVEMRFYAGLSVDATAEVLCISPRTVDLDWSFARAWLYRRLTTDDS